MDWYDRARRWVLPATFPSRRPAAVSRGQPLPGEEPAGHAYEAAQEALYSGPPNDLSAYRLIVNTLWHVALVGFLPPPALHNTLAAILAQGEPAELPNEVWRALNERRRQAIRHAPWTERHYRNAPGPEHL